MINEYSWLGFFNTNLSKYSPTKIDYNIQLKSTIEEVNPSSPITCLFSWLCLGKQACLRETGILLTPSIHVVQYNWVFFLYRYKKIILLNSTVAYTLCRNLDHLGKLLLIKGLLVYKTIQQFCSLADLSNKNVSITQTPVTTKVQLMFSFSLYCSIY